MSQTSRGTLQKLLVLLARAMRKTVLHPRESMLMIRMAAWLIIVSVAVKLTSLPRVLQLVSTRVPSDTLGANQSVALKLVHAIDLLLATDVLMFRPSCWRRAIVLHRYLALNGIESRINFGVKKDSDGKVVGHAWLEHQGEPILEDAPQAYKVTFTFPSDRAFRNDLSWPPEIRRT